MYRIGYGASFTIATASIGEIASHAMTVAHVDVGAFDLAHCLSGELPGLTASAIQRNLRRAYIRGLPEWSSHSPFPCHWVLGQSIPLFFSCPALPSAVPSIND